MPLSPLIWQWQQPLALWFPGLYALSSRMVNLRNQLITPAPPEWFCVRCIQDNNSNSVLHSLMPHDLSSFFSIRELLLLAPSVYLCHGNPDFFLQCFGFSECSALIYISCLGNSFRPSQSSHFLWNLSWLVSSCSLFMFFLYDPTYCSLYVCNS